MTNKNQRLFELVQPTWDYVKKGLQHTLTLHLSELIETNGLGRVDVRFNGELMVGSIHFDPDDPEALWYVREMVRRMWGGPWTGQYDEVDQGECDTLSVVIECVLGFAVRELEAEFEGHEADKAMGGAGA